MRREPFTLKRGRKPWGVTLWVKSTGVERREHAPGGWSLEKYVEPPLLGL